MTNRERISDSLKEVRMLVIEYLHEQFESGITHEEKSRLSSWTVYTEEMEKMIKYGTCKEC